MLDNSVREMAKKKEKELKLPGESNSRLMELFGSFPRGFWEAYHDKRGIPPEYDAFRRDLYQLYYLLVHVNLFGSSYVGSVERALSDCGS